jgi:SPP1 gp7 family putative phage head morphogenesis protein
MGTEKDIDKLHKQLYEEVAKRIESGEDYFTAFNYVIAGIGYNEELYALIVSSSAEVFTEVLSIDIKKTETFVRETFMNEVWKEKYPTYKTAGESITDSIETAQQIVRDSMKKNDTIQETAYRLKRSVEMKKDVSKQILQLADDSKRFASGAMTDGEYMVFKRDIIRAKKYAQGLASRAGSNQDLKKAYLNLISKIESGSEKAVASALKGAIITKMKYNAQRIATTEQERAYGQAKMNEFIKNDVVIGYKRRLSSSHNVTDICDAIDGIFFPKDTGPPHPIHPNDKCDLVPVFRSDFKITESRSKADIKERLDSFTEGEKVKIMGHKGFSMYEKNGSITNIRGWEPFEKKLYVKIG